jgi:NADPH2:quinone reductase
MDAIYLVKHGKSEVAFERRPFHAAQPQNDEVLIEVEAFGLNFADVMARLGHYNDCPPLPAIIGYEVVGKVSVIGKEVVGLAVGDRVLGFTRFGAYAQFAVAKGLGVVKIDDYDANKALALGTQYCTAYYAAHVATNILPCDRVLIHAAAGGVGTALIQLAKLVGCKIYGTAGSDSKLKYLREQGVDVPINYKKDDFSKVIKEPIDVAFDSIGGENFRKSYKLLNQGGRIVGYGAAFQTETSNIFSKAKFGLDFGIYHPAQFLMESRSLIGVNMLRIADHRMDIMKLCLDNVVALALADKIDPTKGGMYPISELGKAHDALQNRQTIGKVGVYW